MSLDRVRLVDVARHAGVSTATVSRALSNQPGVSTTMAERIRKIAEDLGYVVNEQARSLASGASRTVGLIVHEIDDPYFSEISGGILAEAREAGLMVHIAHSGRDPQAEVQQARLLIANGVRAIIIAGSGMLDVDHRQELDDVLHRFQRQGGVVSLIGRHHFDAASVRPDNVASGRDITRHLLELGHRRFAFIRGDRELTTIADRLQGMEEALLEAGIDPRTIPVERAPFHRSGGYEAASRLIQAHPHVTAIMTLNDAMAIGTLSALKERGVYIPHDISVTGFNDIAVSRDLSPALTTVRFPLVEAGRIALRNTLQPSTASPEPVLLPHELCIRDSTAPPRSCS